MCTAVIVKDKGNNVVSGRTLEFSARGDIEIKAFPREYQYGRVHTLDTVYQYIGKYAQMTMQDASPITAIAEMNMEGFNEKGLACQTFYFKKYGVYKYKPKTEFLANDLDVYHLGTYLLANCKNLEEVKVVFDEIKDNIYAVEGVNYHPMHFNLYDRTGDCVAIESENGDFVLKDNPAKVMTNSPSLEFHLQNMVQYLNLTPYDENKNVGFVDIDGEEHSIISSGIGTIGLPGSQFSPHRFVRAAYFQRTAALDNKLSETIATMWTIINKFDIAYGSVREKVPAELYDNKKLRPYLTYVDENPDEIMDISLFTSVSNLTELKMQYKDYRNHSIREIDLHDFDWNGKEVKTIKVYEDQVPRVTKVTFK